MRPSTHPRERIRWSAGTLTLFMISSGLLGFLFAKAHYADHEPWQWLFEQMAITAVSVSCVLWLKGVLDRTKPS